MNRTVLQLFAKPPVQGLVKTRLIKDIGVKSATEVYRHCLQKNIRLLQDSPFDHQIWLTQASMDPVFNHQPVFIQQGKDLGAKMYHAMTDALTRQKYARVLLLGTDCLDLSPRLLHKVNRKLDQNDLVIVPARDGGYVLIAAKNRIDQTVFQKIDWGSEKVLLQTLERVMQNSISSTVLNSVRDIDRIDDLQHYAELTPYL